MRRRSERKKSTDVSSPAPASRRTSRRSRKSPSLSENENNVEESPAHVVPNPHDFDDNVRASSEDRASKPVRRTGTRTSRKRSPITSPTKKRNPRADSAELKVDPIPEEDDKEIPSKVEIEHESANECVTDEASINNDRKFAESKEECSFENETSVQEKECELKSETDKQENITSIVVETEIDKCFQTLSEPNSKSEDLHIDEKNEMKIENSIENIVDKEEIDEPVHGTNKEDFENENLADDKCENEYSKFPGTESSRNEVDRTESREVELEKVDALEFLSDKKIEASSTVEGENICIKKRKLITRNSSVGYDYSCTLNKAIGSNKNARKHKWVTKSKEPTLAISSDSLKNLIDDVHLVPLSDVKLECSSESDETTSEREEGENSPTPERVIRQHSVEKNEKVLKRPYLETSNNLTTEIINQQMLANIIGNPNSQTFTNNTKTTVTRSPSPAKNQKSSILYITNLVRPFTLLQLKGLLARTGKIVEDGFWMDRIKSKCYVQYETADEAIETRHALHGVRWPVSNPKCLHVEFSSIDDMQCAIQSTKEDAPKFGQENNKDSVLTGSGWSRERNEVDEKKTTKPVREWDVGKKESSEREKKGENERSRERDRDKEDRTGRGRDLSTGIRENEKDRRQRLHARERSHSHSPARKLRKQENDPPLRLLDDLFRKTKATPCIYWLPLTPEQIAEKEAFRLKRIEEHKERVKQRELEREKERGKERDRNRNERERDTRRNRSVDRRRSRSRERRRY